MASSITLSSARSTFSMVRLTMYLASAGDDNVALFSTPTRIFCFFFAGPGTV